MKGHYLPIFFILTFCCQQGFGQNGVIDSLRHVLKNQNEDTNKVIILNKLSDALETVGRYDSSLVYGKNAEILAEKLDFKKGISSALLNIGIIYNHQGNYPKAIEYYLNALAINQKTGNKKSIASDFGNIAITYGDEGDYAQALDYDLKALEIDKELDDKNKITTILGNIGVVYYLLAKRIDGAYQAKAEKRDLTNPNNKNTDSLFNKALEYYLKAMEMSEKLGDKNGIARDMGNIGLLYEDMGNYSEALGYYFKALKMEEELCAKKSIALNIGNIGALYSRAPFLPSPEGETKKGFVLAEKYLGQAIAIDDSIGEKNDMMQFEELMAQLYDTTHRSHLAFIEYQKAMILKDTIFSEESRKQFFDKEMTYKFEKKESEEKAEYDKKVIIQREIRNSFIAGFALMFAIAFFIFRGYRQKQKANIIISQQKEQVEKQKGLVEEKNKDILDSITYAKRLQDAILPPLSLIKQCLAESFLFYKPKDIVAGDFYWLERAGDTILIAAADCTGHGVPGALVSVVCSNALNRTVKEFHITEPGKILDKVRELVLETFEKSEDNVQDGMDISLAAISHQSLANSFSVRWSGAYNSLWYVHSGEVIEIPADKQPIGKNDKPLPFNTHNLSLQKGDILYLFTDGYADQFGGPKGKKFKYKQMQELLLANAAKPMDEQKKILEGALEGWKGNLEQVDDILVIGIRV